MAPGVKGSTQRRHALVVAYHFSPDARAGTLRSLRVVRHLVANNYDVTVLTGDPRTYRSDTPVDPRLLEQIPPGVRIVRARVVRGFEALKGVLKGARRIDSPPSAPPVTADVSKFPSRRSLLLQFGDVIDGALAIPDHESGWYVPAVLKGIRACAGRAPDVVYSSAPPWTGQLVAYTLASIFRRPWVADFRDPWGRAPWRSDRYPFAMSAARALERKVISRADRVLFVSRANRDEFANHYGTAHASKFHVVPNGCDVTEFGTPITDVPVNPFVLLHAGTLYAGRTPEPLFQALATAIRSGVVNPDTFRLRFIGVPAAHASSFAAACEALGLSRVVEFAERVPRAESVRAIQSASALLLLQPGHGVAVPAKLYEYLAARRPILAIAEGETADLVRSSGAGVVTAGGEQADIVRALADVQRMASGGPLTVAADLFDGDRRAAEAVSIIEEMLRHQAATGATVFAGRKS